jgi:hypothetical protein
MSQETDKHDETTRGNGYMKLSSMLKDSKKSIKRACVRSCNLRMAPMGGELVLIRPLLCKETEEISTGVMNCHWTEGP